MACAADYAAPAPSAPGLDADALARISQRIAETSLTERGGAGDMVPEPQVYVSHALQATAYCTSTGSSSGDGALSSLIYEDQVAPSLRATVHSLNKLYTAQIWLRIDPNLTDCQRRAENGVNSPI
jgi:hypothetical protein